MSCPQPLSLARWADGEATENEAQALTFHVRGCERCRREWQKLEAIKRRLAGVWARPVDNRFVGDVLRMTTKGSPTRRWPTAAVATGAAAVFLGLASWLFSEQPQSNVVGPRPPALASRGGAAPTNGGGSSPSLTRSLGFGAFVHRGGPTGRKEPLRANASVARGDGLSFVLFNRTKAHSWFMLFAVDAAGDVHWFAPAYLTADSNPVALALAGEPEISSLEEGMVPDAPAAGELVLAGLFSPSSLTVRDVEQALSDGGIASLGRRYPAAQLQLLSVQVLEASNR